MAIAFNAAADLGNNSGLTNSLTVSYTCSSGSDRLLIVHFDGDIAAGADDITGVTYAGVSMTQLGKVVGGLSQARNVYTYYLLGPATGANNVVISCTATHYLIATAADYTGVTSVGEPDASTTNQSAAAATTLTTSLTSITDRDWEILGEAGYNANNPPSASTGATRRTFDAAFGAVGLFDHNAAITPAGSVSMTTTRTTAVNSIEHIAGDFAPVADVAQPPPPPPQLGRLWIYPPYPLAPQNLLAGRNPATRQTIQPQRQIGWTWRYPPYCLT